MAGRLAFHYIHRESMLHRWDARCKLPALFLASVGILHMYEVALSAFSALLVAAVICARLPWNALLRDLKMWGLFLAVIFCLQALFHTGDGQRIVDWLPVGIDGLHRAALTCWRLLLILSFAAVFTAVTRPRDLQNAIIWFLGPFPFLPARRIALMAALTTRFLPSILDRADDIRTASRSRLGDTRKNPLQRMKYFALPLFRRSLIQADELALALAARGYREDLPVRMKRIPATHFSGLLCLALAVALITFGLPEELRDTFSVFFRFLKEMA